MPRELRLEARITAPGGGREVVRAARGARRAVQELSGAARGAGAALGGQAGRTARLDRLNRNLGRSAASAARGIDRTAAAASRAERSARGLAAAHGGVLRALGRYAAPAVAAGLFAGFVRDTVRTVVALESVEAQLSAATGGAAAAAVEWERLAALADRLGLAFQPLAGSFARFAAATRGTALEGEQGRRIFESFAESAAVLQLSAADLEGVMTTLEQIISKGTVSAEELRGQLGERLPGAFQIAARAVGVTTEELDDMLRNGQLLAEDLLPALARQLREEFGAGLADSTRTARAEFERLANAVDDLQRSLLDSDVAARIARGATRLVRAVTPEAGAARPEEEILADIEERQAALAEASRRLQSQSGSDFAAALSGRANPRDEIRAIRLDLDELNNELGRTRLLSRQAAEAAADEARAAPPPEVGREAQRVLERLADAEARRLEETVRITREYEAQAAVLRADPGLSDAARREALARLEAERDARLRDADARRLQAAAARELERLDRGAALRGSGAEVEQARIQREREARRAEAEAVAAQAAREAADFGAGARRALSDVAGFADESGSQIQYAIGNAFLGAEDALANFVRTGELSFGRLVDSMISDLARLALQQAVIGPLARLLGGLLGGGGGLAGAPLGDGSGFAGFAHGGGIAGRLAVRRPVPALAFAGAPRLHRGGLAGDEVPAVLRRGEGVFTPEQMAALGPRGPMSVEVRIANEGGQRIEARGAEAQIDGDRLIVGVVVDDIANNGPVAGALAQSFGLRRQPV